MILIWQVLAHANTLTDVTLTVATPLHFLLHHQHFFHFKSEECLSQRHSIGAVGLSPGSASLNLGVLSFIAGLFEPLEVR
jgi:hypothetical protein